MDPGFCLKTRTPRVARIEWRSRRQCLLAGSRGSAPGRPSTHKGDLTYMHEITLSAYEALKELIEVSGIGQGDAVVIGCSSSEVLGARIGSAGTLETAQAVLIGLNRAADEKGVVLCVQCCEHLNRALVMPKKLLKDMALTQVWALPHERAGGSLATAYYHSLAQPVLAESIQALAALDIGDTLIGMHVLPTAVPVRLKTQAIGAAHLTAARSRPKLIGGERARYPKE